jgi:hypothetical protein
LQGKATFCRGIGIPDDSEIPMRPYTYSGWDGMEVNMIPLTLIARMFIFTIRIHAGMLPLRMDTE